MVMMVMTILMIDSGRRRSYYGCMMIIFLA